MNYLGTKINNTLKKEIEENSKKIISKMNNSKSPLANETKGSTSNGSGDMKSVLQGNPSFDAFTLCGLADDSINGPYFTPILIKSASIIGESEDDGVPGLNIKLPLNPQKITDSVSVSFNRRIDNIAGSSFVMGFAQQASDTLGDIGDYFESLKGKLSLSPQLQNMLMFNYDARSLRKEIQIPFIIPITNHINVDDLRKGLNILQGLVYPRHVGLTYPPFISITIGGIYVRLKGFISQVSIEFDETITDIGGIKFSTIVSGSIHFVCLHPFSWSHLGIDSLKGTYDEFVLMDKTLLFGKESGSLVSKSTKYLPPLNTRSYSNYTNNHKKTLKSLENRDFLSSSENLNSVSNNLKLNNYIEMYDIEPLNEYFEKQNDLILNLDTSFLNEDIFKNTDFNKIIDQSSINILTKFSDAQNKLSYELSRKGALGSLDINLNTSTFNNSLNNLVNSFNSISNPSIFSSIMNTIKNKNIIGDINNLTNAVNTTVLIDMINNTNKIHNSLKNNINIISNMDLSSPLDLNNVFEYALNKNGFNKQIKAISLDTYSLDKNVIKNLIYSNSLSDIIRINNTLLLIESLIKNINTIYEYSNTNIAIETICKIQSSVNILFLGNIIVTLTDMQKQSSQVFNDFCNIEYTNNNINFSIKEQAELSYNELSTLMPYNMDKSISALHSSLTNLLSGIIF